MIRIRGLSKTYADGQQALRGLDLELGEGMLGLLGPNGAGKTTFLSLLVLAVEPSSGERLYDELDATRPRDRAAIRSRLGYLPQDFAPVGHLTGLEYLVHCARLRGVGLAARAIERRARELLEAVDLAHAAARRAGEYSGGMKRRLGIAQALIHAPRLLVVDEPTSGLDPAERIHFRNLITEAADHIPVLLSTHIVEDVEATCPRLAVIAAGRLCFDGTPGELLRRAAGRLWELPAEAPPTAGATILARRRMAG
ncbi:MAG TPA: ATP-binding cassette domain-containing protein, partial [Candidatus Polarisedimenticolaceae bacterium]|nr:ATP-binding cassette domain-containing protein [Candidatus Polarisedimenticolaceae bacterium]